ncbi:MAG: cation transporter [Eubacterium sp.]|nr:cation transporter [Eubacterium sp.]
MTKLLIAAVNRKNEAERRDAFSSLSGITGIICNLILCVVKFTVGALAGSVSVTADAVNNLSDCATNVVTLTGTRLSKKPDDKEHPFGHGRAEYISAMIVAISIFVVGFELAKSSVEKIIHPQDIRFNIWYIVVLGATVFVKLWMAYFNAKLYKLTDNLNLKGVRQDSLNDCVATVATMISVILANMLNAMWIDGVIGIGVSLFVFWYGAGLLRSVISTLLGEPPAKDVTNRIEMIITDNDIVLGMHDLMIHNYGANKVIASADAEVDANADVFTIHEVIDTAERRIFDELGIEMCIHMDPVDTADIATRKLKKFVKQTVKAYNPEFSFHDCRFAEKDGNKYITFDLTIPFGDSENKEQIEADITSSFSDRYPDYKLGINIEHSYT